MRPNKLGTMMPYKEGTEFEITLPLDEAERLRSTIRYNERFMLVLGFVLGFAAGIAGTLGVLL